MGHVYEINEDRVQAAKTALPGVKLCLIEVNLDDGSIFHGIFREPTSAAVSKYVSDNMRADKSKDAMINHNAFVLESAIDPTKEAYFELLKDLPALSIAVASKLIEGHGLATDSKKKSL